jgi:hypothetical protein
MPALESEDIAQYRAIFDADRHRLRSIVVKDKSHKAERRRKQTGRKQSEEGGGGGEDGKV